MTLLGALTLSRSPSVPPNPAPGAATALGVQNLLDRARQASERPGAQLVSANQSELTAVAVLGGRALGFDHTALQAGDPALVAQISMPLPLGFWVNVSALVEGDKAGAPLVSGKIGRLPVPSAIAHSLISVVRFVLRMRGVDVPPIDQVVQDLKSDAQGVAARLDLPKDAGSLLALRPGGGAPIDPLLVRAYYCHLVEAQSVSSDHALAGQLERAFASVDGSVAQNRAALVAVAMVAVSPKVARLVGNPGDLLKDCGRIDGEILLAGRADLAKHWALSAALAATVGAEATAIAGTWKEIADSGPSGSGFSYVDLAADRSGVRAGERASSPVFAAQTAAWLRDATDSNLLPIAELALSEGLSEAEFVRHYHTIDSAAYGAVIARIDRALAKGAGD